MDVMTYRRPTMSFPNTFRNVLVLGLFATLAGCSPSSSPDTKPAVESRKQEIAPERVAQPPSGPAARYAAINCISHMRVIALGMRMYSNEHQENFPFNLSTNQGGTMELCSRRANGFDDNTVLHLQAISNLLKEPKFLICPLDTQKKVAANFPSLTTANVTYQLRSGTNVNEVSPREILGRCPLHGFIMYCDGSAWATNRN